MSELNREQIIKALECCLVDIEESERLRAEVSVKKKLLDKCVDLENTVKADTVRKMQEMLGVRIKDNLAYHGWYLKETVIPSIATEMLEEGK